MNPPQVYMCSPSWTLLPPHTIPLGHPSAPAPSIQYRASNLDWRLISYMILYMFQCHSPKSFRPLPLPQSPSLMAHVVHILSKKSSPNPGSHRLFSMFSSRNIIGFFFLKILYFLGKVRDLYLDCVCVSVCLCVCVCVCIWISTCSSTIYWKDYSFSMELFSYFVKNQLTIFVWVYFWALYSVPLLYVSILSSNIKLS